MASSSLNNMTVPAPGSDTSGQSSLLMPKLQYRFRVLFSNFGISAGESLTLTRQVTQCARPTVEFGEIEIPIYNSRIYLAGKPTWSNLQMTLRDDAGGNISKVVGEQIQKQFDFTEQASAQAGINYKFQLNIQILDGGNGTDATALETWELYGCYITTANYQELNYSTNDPVTIQLTVRFDNAVQTNGAGDVNGLPGGVGAALGSLLAGTQTGSTGITGVGSVTGQ